jgi:spore germination protein YaaH
VVTDDAYVISLLLLLTVADPIVDSAHQAALRGEIEDTYVASPAFPKPPAAPGAPLRINTGVVYGYFPAGYQLSQIKGWDELTHIVWFGPTINSSGTMGSTAGLGGAVYNALRAETRARGIYLVIGLINFNTQASPNSVSTLLQNKTTAVNTIQKLVTDYDADGVSLDFEVVPESSKQAYVSFLSAVSETLHAIDPMYNVSSAIPPPTGWKGYDYQGIAENSDLAIIMAYDYYWKGGPTAGPVTPKNNGTKWGGINLTTSLDSLATTLGELKSKVVIALPWYGYSWPTTSASVPGSTTSRPNNPAFAPTCASGKNRITGAGRSYDDASEQPYSVYYDAEGPRQMWLDDAESFAGKMDLVKARNFGGIGMFQLGYEGDAPEFWTAISERYTEIDDAPTAVIVAPTQVVLGSTVTLDGAGSSDPEGLAVSFDWSSSAGVLSATNTANVSLVANTLGAMTVSLTVSDGRLSTTTEQQIEVVAEIKNTAPVTATTTPAVTPEAPSRQSISASTVTGAKGCQQAGSASWLWLLTALLVLRKSRAGGRGKTAKSA